MRNVVLYLATLVAFLALDAVAISWVILPLFERHVGALMIDPPRIAPAVVFYAAYIAGVLHFVSLPALRAGRIGQTAVQGFLLGLMCYATYEFTNYATLRDWSPVQVAVDTLWGGIVTGASAWIGLQAARRVG